MRDATTREILTMRDALAELRREQRSAELYQARYGDEGNFKTRERHQKNLERAKLLIHGVERLLRAGEAPSEPLLRQCGEIAQQLYPAPPLQARGVAAGDSVGMSEPWRLEFELHGLPTCGSKRERMHWRRLNDENKRWYRDVWGVVWEPMRGRRPLESAHVTYTRCSSVQPDQTNLAASFKGVEDGLVRAGVLTDDAPQFVQNEYLWSYAPPRSGRIRVVVEEVRRAPRGVDCHDGA